METWNKWVKSILMAFLRPQRTCLPGNENCFFSTTTQAQKVTTTSKSHFYG